MSRTRIVAVDDDRRVLRILKRACESVGFEAHSVHDGTFFASAFRVFRPAVVFLDLNMREMDGVELLRFMATEGSDTAIVLTSGVDQRLLMAAQSLGVSLGLRMLEPIRKPLIVSEVRKRLAALDAPAPAPLQTIAVEELAEALEEGRVEVCYQPMIDLTTRRVLCAEALARIRRSDGGLLIPDQFIPVAERSDLIGPLTLAVLRTALTDLGGWQAPVPDIQVSVNVSPGLLEDVDLPDRFDAELARARVDPRRLVVEVTETGVPRDRARMVDSLSRLRLKGISLALDDFGTGFCSLGQLYEFPYETLKLDKQFAMRADENPDAAAMIRSSLDLARSVGLSVVAEGIQSEGILRWLGRMGCDFGQGFHISPPMPAAAFNDWLLRLDRLGPRPDHDAPHPIRSAAGC